ASVYFDAKFYLEENPDLKSAFGTNYVAAFTHWITEGLSDGRVASPHFNIHSYLKANPDLNAAFGTNYAAAFIHWLGQGLSEGRITVDEE
ncbi:MAG: peptidase M10, partial [Desulfamplus sp.]|nr:peptidase M10 [Desulfamplus sp.]